MPFSVSKHLAIRKADTNVRSEPDYSELRAEFEENYQLGRAETLIQFPEISKKVANGCRILESRQKKSTSPT